MNEYLSDFISVIMATYNAEDFIATAIESVIIQSYRYFELIIWNDGSTDKTLEIAQSYASRHEQIKLFSSPENCGHVKTMKKAINAAVGEYIGILDSDDYLDPECLEKAVCLIKDKPEASYVYTQYIDIDQHDNFIGLGKRCQLPYDEGLLLSTFNTFHFQLIRHSSYDRINGFDERYLMAADYDLCLRLSEVGEYVYQVEEPLYYYRDHPNSMSKQRRDEQIKFARMARNEALSRRYGNQSL